MTDAVTWGYWGIFWLMVLENVVPPVPSEVIMSVGGIAAARGKMDFGLLVAVGTLGCVVGNMSWYALGRWLGYRRLKPFVDRWGRWLTLDWSDVERLHGHFVRRGGVTVLIFRFMPVGRTMISLPAGMMAMPVWRFITFTAAGSLVWNFFLVGLGYWLGATVDAIDVWVEPLLYAIIAALLAWYLWRVLTWKARGSQAQFGDAARGD